MNNIVSLAKIYDYRIYHFLYQSGLDSGALSRVYYLFAKYGIIFFLLSFTYLIWMKRINAFLCSFIAMALGGFFDLLIFMVWQRPRPFISHADLAVPALRSLDVERMSSFPSSHTYIVFAIAVSVYLYGHKKLGIILFILAIGVAIGRIGTGLHYPSDVVAGIILGILSGVLAYRFVSTNEHKWEYDHIEE